MSVDPVGSRAWLAEQRDDFQRLQFAQQKASFELLKASFDGTFYKAIDADDVDVSRRLVAGFILPLAAQHLEISQPSLSWFCPCSGHAWLKAQRDGLGGFFKSDVTIWGRARRGEVLLNAETPLSKIAETLAHELRHCYQSTLPGFRDADRDALELDASGYAQRWQSTGRLLGMVIASLPAGQERTMTT